MFVMLHAEQLCSSKRAIRGEGLSEWKKWEKGGFLGRKSYCCTLMSLKTYKQIIKSEVIVILRRVSPLQWRTVQGPEGSLFKVSLTVFPFAPSFLVVLFSSLPAKPVLSQVGSKQGQG